MLHLLMYGNTMPKPSIDVLGARKHGCLIAKKDLSVTVVSFTRLVWYQKPKALKLPGHNQNSTGQI